MQLEKFGQVNDREEARIKAQEITMLRLFEKQKAKMLMKL